VYLSTDRLVVRDFTAADLDASHALLDLDLHMDDLDREGRRRWLEWTVLDYKFRARAHQPGYGEYAVAAADGGEVVGVVGIVPSMMPFALLPGYPTAQAAGQAFAEPAVGLFWSIGSAHQRQGYAAEAGAAVMGFCFTELGAGRVVATTEHDNAASIGVMRRLGMQVVANPGAAPFYLQVVGWRDHPGPAPEWPTQP